MLWHCKVDQMKVAPKSRPNDITPNSRPNDVHE
jgi:hypothetical protein